MPAKKGADHGGIRSIEGIRLRCFCDPDTGCWHWRGSLGKSSDRPGREPMLWRADLNRTQTVMRAAWELGRPTKLRDDQIVWRRCRQADCANPAHLLAGTRADYGAWAEARGFLRGRPERRIINRANRATQTALTMELAQWTRESQQTLADMAHAFGCSQTVVCRARKGRTFGLAMPSASVFMLGAAAANDARRGAAGSRAA